MRVEEMYITEGNGVNVLIAGVASIPTWLAVVNDPHAASGPSFLTGLVASVVLLFLGKLMDLAIRMFVIPVVQTFLEKRRGDGKTNSKIEDSSDDTHKDQAGPRD